MAKKSKKSTTLDEPAETILSALLAEFKEKGFGTEELRNTYRGLSPAALKSTCCADRKLSEVDFDLAMSDLDEGDLVKTGPMMAYENPPGSYFDIVALYSKNEYSYLTQEGYKAATKLSVTKPPRMAVPNVHISGGTFNQSPIGVGAQVSQKVNIQQRQQNIVAGDWEHLAKVLRTAGVSDPELDELSTAVREDGKTMGARVKGWISKAAPKVLSGGVRIGVSVGQTLLVEYLKQYYGLS
ncbi:MAG: hypothetical protein WBC78_07930 [Candidatus Sulfotelmatobacter sp.]